MNISSKEIQSDAFIPLYIKILQYSYKLLQKLLSVEKHSKKFN